MIFPNPYTMFINGKNVNDYGAVVQSYKIGGTQFENSVFRGRNRTTLHLLSQPFGTRQINVTLFFEADTQRELAMNKSAIDALLIGTPELHLPDGFYYSCVMESAGEASQLGVENNKMIASCSYVFSGIRHDALQTVEGNTVIAEGTAPQMDARFACVASADYESIQLGPVTFYDIAANDVIVADGINGVLKINGVPSAQKTHFVKLPFLVPGEQIIICPEIVTVEYYPVWI